MIHGFSPRSGELADSRVGLRVRVRVGVRVRVRVGVRVRVRVGFSVKVRVLTGYCAGRSHVLFNRAQSSNIHAGDAPIN